MSRIIPGTDVPYNPTIESILLRVDELRPERVDSIRRVAKDRVFLVARKAYPTKPLVVRDMTAQDLGQTNIEWTDTTGSGADAWEDHIVAGGTTYTIADGRFVAITGCRVMEINIPGTLPVTAFRFSVGGARVAMWDLYKLYPATALGITLANVVGGVPNLGGITESPIIVSEGIEIKIEQWVATASTAFVIAIEGVTCELQGKILNP